VLAGAWGWFATGAGVGLAVFLWKKPNPLPEAVGDGAAGGTGLLAGVVIGEAAAVASFLDLFFGVALAAGVALATGAAGLGAGLAALCDLFFGVAEAAGVGVAVCEYASGEAAIANRARSERNLRIQLFYLDFTPLGNPGSERKHDF
jgi:hypothetical protein